MSMFLLFYSRSTGLLSVNVLARQVLICICISQVDRFQIVIIPFRVFDRISRVFRPIHTGDFLLQFDRCDLLLKTRVRGYAGMRICGYADMRVRRTGLTNRFQKLMNNSNKIIAVNTKNHSCEGVFICGKTHVDFHKTLTSIFSAYTTSIY